MHLERDQTTLDELLQDKVFLTKIIWLGFISSLVIMGIGLWVILKNLLG
jgi:hypothetical protein